MIQDRVIRKTNRKPYPSIRTVPFPVTLSEPESIDFNVTILFNVKQLENGTR